MATYDVFISYRNADPDTAMAESLYHALRAKGYHPFFSKYSIDAMGRSEYVDLINDAMEHARILVAVGSCRENLTCRWVKGEINTFTSLMMREEEGARIILSLRTPDYPVVDLPVNLAAHQSFVSEAAAMQMIDACIKRTDAPRTTEALPPNQAGAAKPSEGKWWHAPEW